MSNLVPAPEGTNVVVLDRADRSTYRLPVLAFEVHGSIAYPICAMAFGGLLSAQRALEMGGFISDRGFEVPFDSEESWVMWAMSVEPGEPETIGSIPQPETVAAAAPEATVIKASVNEPAGDTTKVRAERPPRARKTFASKSFWSRTNMLGVLEVVEIEPGHGLPLDTEGFEKIKRDEYAAFKKQAKGGDDQVVVIGWDNGPVVPGESEEIIEETLGEQTDDGEEDFGGLV